MEDEMKTLMLSCDTGFNPGLIEPSTTDRAAQTLMEVLPAQTFLAAMTTVETIK